MHEDIYIFENNEYLIPTVDLFFKRWIGEPIKNTFGGKPLINYEGVPMFAELAIQRMAVLDGWSARWVCTYSAHKNNPYFLVNWLDKALDEQKIEPIKDTNVQSLMEKIARENDNSFAGCWDVFVWNSTKVCFLESKRLKKDGLRETQLCWLKAGLSAGLTINNFLIVQWDFKN